MDATIRDAWADTLESGKYEQGKNRLNRDGKMCCLGVLCELAIEAGVQVNRQSHEWEGITTYSYDGQVSLPPAAVTDWAGLPRDAYGSAAAIALDSGAKVDIVMANDAVGAAFAEIARGIRRSL